MAPRPVLRGVDHHRGVDVSVWQGGSVDWPTVARCADFAVVKVGGGDGGIYVDRTYAGNRDRSRGVLPRGGYWFLGWGRGREQARACLAATDGYAGFELPLTLDVETYGPSGQYRPTAGDVADFIDEFHQGTERRWTGPTGRPVAVIVYTGAPLANVTGALPWLVHHDLWLAAYLSRYYPAPWDGVTNGCPPNVAALGLPDRFIPAPWASWSAWQFAGGDGGIGGVGNGRSNCDQDVMTVECFARLTGAAPPNRPQTTPEGDWFDMATKEDLLAVVRQETNPNGGEPIRSVVDELINEVRTLREQVAKQTNPNDADGTPSLRNVADAIATKVGATPDGTY